jgi:hypothetical protein
VGRTDGHGRGDPATASGEIRWPPTGRFPWPPSPTSLTKYRARLLLHGKEQLALQNTLRLAEELGMLEGTAEQIIDSTPMLGAAATQDTVRLVRHGCASCWTRSWLPMSRLAAGWRLSRSPWNFAVAIR